MYYIKSIEYSQLFRKANKMLNNSTKLEIDYDNLATLVSDKLAQKLTTHRLIPLHQARVEILHRKSPEWIKHYLVRPYGDEILFERGANTAWMNEPSGTGHRVYVDPIKATKWVKAHESEIDWRSPEPITLRRAAGLSPQIKRN